MTTRDEGLKADESDEHGHRKVIDWTQLKWLNSGTVLDWQGYRMVDRWQVRHKRSHCYTSILPLD